MARQELFSIIANETSQRYTNYLEQILAAYNRTILSKNLNAKSVSMFKKEVENLNKHYLEREVDNIVALYHSVKQLVDEDTKGQSVSVTDDDEWGTYLSDNTDFLFEAIKLQSTKDALFASNFMRSKVLEVLALNDYEVAYDLVFNGRDLSFFYTDKIGRKLNSVKYIRTVARDYLVKNYNDLIAGAAILNGVAEVTLINTDIEHKDHEKTISVNGQNTVNYFSIRTDTFHPNTNTIIRL